VDDSAELVETLYAAFSRGDLSRLSEVLDPQVEFVNPEYAIEGGVRRGPAQFRDALERLRELFDYADMEIARTAEIGEDLVVEVRVRAAGRESGAPIDDHFGHVWRIRGGRVERFCWFRSYEEALAAAERHRSDDAELVRLLYELWMSGRHEEALARVDPEIEWIDPPNAPDSDTHVGREGILFSTDRWLSGFENWWMEVERVRDLGEGKVLVEIRQHGRGRGSSVDVEAMVFHLWTVSGGRAVRMQMFLEESEALAAADPSRPEARS
jgi:ketosteroid isomerase-like protein